MAPPGTEFPCARTPEDPGCSVRSGDVKAEAQELSEQIKMRMEMGVTEIPDELIQKAEIIVHQVSLGFGK